MTENERELNELFQTDVYFKIVPMIHDFKFIYQIGLDGFHVQLLYIKIGLARQVRERNTSGKETNYYDYCSVGPQIISATSSSD